MKSSLSALNVKPKVGVVVVAAGKGERTGLTYNKVLYNIGHKTVLESVLDKLKPYADQIIIVCADFDLPKIRDIAELYDAKVVLGGDTRFLSVYNGLKALTPCDIALIHDGARPFLNEHIITECIKSALLSGSGVAAVPAIDTVKQQQDGKVTTLDRSTLYNVQTPQAFNYARIIDAYSRFDGDSATDDSAVYEYAGNRTVLVNGDYNNTKITTAADLFRLNENINIGVGFDVHRLVSGRALILGGVELSYEKGLLGHSDADVLTHAVMDAMLSAANLPDIGVLFPDDSPDTLDISSMVLLDKVKQMIDSRYSIVSVSAVIAAQKPKLAPIIPDIKASLAQRLGIEKSCINISATTTEGLGIIGNGDAIAANAACILNTKNTENNQND